MKVPEADRKKAQQAQWEKNRKDRRKQERLLQAEDRPKKAEEKAKLKKWRENTKKHLYDAGFQAGVAGVAAAEAKVATLQKENEELQQLLYVSYPALDQQLTRLPGRERDKVLEQLL